MFNIHPTHIWPPPPPTPTPTHPAVSRQPDSSASLTPSGGIGRKAVAHENKDCYFDGIIHTSLTPSAFLPQSCYKLINVELWN